MMQQLHEMEMLRLKNQEPISYEQLIKMYGQSNLMRFQQIYDTYQLNSA